jgi:hypothetical protein
MDTCNLWSVWGGRLAGWEQSAILYFQLLPGSIQGYSLSDMKEEMAFVGKASLQPLL